MKVTVKTEVSNVFASCTITFDGITTIGNSGPYSSQGGLPIGGINAVFDGARRLVEAEGKARG